MLQRSAGHDAATKRLCLVLALLAALSGREAASALTAQAFSLATAAQGAELRLLPLAIELLTALVQEADQQSKALRTAVADVTASGLPSLAALVQGIISAYQSNSTALPVVPALACLRAWLKFDATGSGSCALSPGAFVTAHGPLFRSLLQLLAAPDGAVCHAAGELLADVISSGAAGAGHIRAHCDGSRQRMTLCMLSSGPMPIWTV